MCQHHHDATAAGTTGLDRRTFLRLGGAAGGVLTVAGPARFEPASAGRTRTATFSGRFTGVGTPDWHYLPVPVPRGVREIRVSYAYESRSTPVGVSANVIDLGIFDPSGHGLGDAAGFRGWSGGARSSFRISRSHATPGYLAGPITPGLWHIVLGPFVVVPPGVEWTVTVTLVLGRPGRRFRPRPAPRQVRGRGPGWYRGDLHLHTVHSDGRRTQPELLADARAAGLDFLASTEHNTNSASLTWGRYTPRDFLVLNGEEITTRAGHWLAVGLPAGAWVDWRYRPADEQLGRFTDRVRDLGGLAIAAHPFSPLPATRWESGYRHLDALEIWNGPWTGDDQVAVEHWHALLVAGEYHPVVGSSDAHHDGHRVGLPHTVVRAGSLSVGAVVAGLRRGHAWIAESAAVDLEFTATSGSASATCGETLRGDGPVRVRLEVTGVPGCAAWLRTATGTLGAGLADATGRILLEAEVPAGSARAARFVRAEVRRPEPTVPTDPTTGVPGGPMVALTNPILLG